MYDTNIDCKDNTKDNVACLPFCEYVVNEGMKKCVFNLRLKTANEDVKADRSCVCLDGILSWFFFQPCFVYLMRIISLNCVDFNLTYFRSCLSLSNS